MAADSFIETARPPGSADELISLLPLDSRARLFVSFFVLALKNMDAEAASGFEFIVIDIVLSSLMYVFSANVLVG
jgi:hypothetical protein